MSIRSIEASAPQQHPLREGAQEGRVPLSGADAGKLLAQPGVRSVRVGNALVIVDAQGNEFIVKNFYAKALASDDREPQASDTVSDADEPSEEDDELTGKEGDAAEADVQVAAASAEEASDALAEVHLAQASAGEVKPAESVGKDDDSDNDKEAYHWGSVVGLGLLGAGLIGSMGGGGASGPPRDTSLDGKTLAITAVSGDSGVSSADFITSDQTLVISGTSDAPDGARVAVKIDDTVVGYTTVTAGVWSYDHTGATLAAGDYMLDADLVDTAGNVAATAADRALTVDTVADEAAIAGKVIAVTAISNDTGTSGSDFITNDTTLVISGTSNADNGAFVAVRLNGALVGYATVTAGAWSFNHTGTPLAAGSYTLDADLVDAAGNVAASAAQQPLVVDTGVGTFDDVGIVGRTLAISAIDGDLGLSNGDFVTSDTTLVISGTSSADDGSNVAVKLNGVVVGHTTVTAGAWSFDHTGTPLAAGSYTLDADLVDAAGNVAASAVDRTLVIDTVANEAAIAGKVIAVTAISGDTGVSSTDFNTSDQTLTISGTSDATDGANVAVKLNGTIVGYTTVAAGAWSFDHTGTTLAAGSYTLDADLVDVAGNVAASAVDRTLVIDTVANEAAIAGKAIAIIAVSNDSGVSSTDFITSDQTLTIIGTSDATNGANVAVKVNGTIVGYTTVTGGVWSYNHTGTTLAAGSYTLDADLVDVAGNVAASAVDRTLVIDTVADEAAIAGKVIAVTAISNDTGVSGSDFITSDQTLTISGTSDATDGANVAVKVNGTVVGHTTVTGGVWSYNHTGATLAAGSYTLDADLVDTAGNVAATAADQALVVDVSGANGPDGNPDPLLNGRVLAITAITSDNGPNNADFLTNDQTLIISGTSDAANGALVAVKVDGTIVGYTTVTAGVWSYDHTGTTLAAGSYTLAADLIDTAGNIAATAADQALTIDTTLDPAIAGKVIAVTAISDDTGIDGNDFTTNDQTLIISGTSDADDGASVAVKLNGNIIGYTTVTGGVWSYDHTVTPLAGSYTLDADLVDLAGNVAATAADQALMVEVNLELLATPLDGVANLDVKSAIVLNFNQDISLGDGQIRILDMMGTTGWTMTNTSSGISRQDVTDNDVVITLTAGVVTGMTVGGVDYTALGTNGITLADLQASVSISGNKLVIDPAGLDGASGTDWDFDFDFGANYRLEIDANLVKTQNGLINFAGISGTDVEFTTVAPVGNNTGAASQRLDANGALEASYTYHHGHAGLVGGLDVSMNFSVGSHVLVVETGGGTTRIVPGDALGGNISLTGFGADDLIYNDNMGNMSMLTTDGVHAANWGGSLGLPAERYQSGSLQQKVSFVDYNQTWSYMGNLNYGQADGRFEDVNHHNANVIIFG